MIIIITFVPKKLKDVINVLMGTLASVAKKILI
jgi:hypothetical protein